MPTYWGSLGSFTNKQRLRHDNFRCLLRGQGYQHWMNKPSQQDSRGWIETFRQARQTDRIDRSIDRSDSPIHRVLIISICSAFLRLTDSLQVLIAAFMYTSNDDMSRRCRCTCFASCLNVSLHKLRGYHSYGKQCMSMYIFTQLGMPWWLINPEDTWFHPLHNFWSW